MKSAIVTGGCGFVGRHLVRRLLDLGWQVKVVDPVVKQTGGISPEAGWPLFDPREYSNFSYEKIDCREFFLENPQAQFDYIFHLAAIVGGRLMIENNPLSVATDLAIDADMWNWVSNSNIGKVVNFSSSAAYPVSLQQSASSVVKLKESLIKFDGNLGTPDLTYGWSKLTAEYLGKIAWSRHGIKSVVYRPFSGYGTDQDLSYPFPSICKRAIESRNENDFLVWGSGLQSRDFIHIDDCIEGILNTMDKINDGDALNLSTGIATSFIDFAKIATEIVGYNPKISGDTNKPVGVMSRVGDVDKQIEFGFKPKISFFDGVNEGINYWVGK